MIAYLFSSPAIYHRIRDLAISYPDGEIAAILQAEGLSTAKGRVWTARHVMDFRRSNGIPSGFTTTTSLRLPESGYLTSAEVAMRLGIGQATVQKWYKVGILTGQHAGGQAQLWIHWTDDLEERLGGRATPDPRMVSVRALCRTRNQGPDAVLAWSQAQGHQLYRLRRGTAMRFYVLPGHGGAPAATATPPEPARALPPEVVALLTQLTALPQSVRDLCVRLGVDKRRLQTLLVTHQEVLLQQGVRFHVATRSEVAGAIKLPSPLNAQEYTYYSRVSWCQAPAPAGEDVG